MAKKKVVIFGGGVSGLTVAHECIEAGFEVHVYEKNSRCGGKAVGYYDQQGYPVEHGLRTYALGYFSLLDTLKRIPYDACKTVFDNLVPCHETLYASISTAIPDRAMPRSTAVPRWKHLASFIKNMREWGISWGEILYFFWIPLTFLMSCEGRRKNLWQHSFIDHYELNRCTQNFRTYLLGLVEVVVAAKPTVCVPVINDLLCRLIFISSSPHKLLSRISFMNGPTNERFIDPWVSYLKKAGVIFHLECAIQSLAIDQQHQRVEEAITHDGSKIQADAFVLAIPAPHIQTLVPALPLPKTQTQEWSLGLQFYLQSIPQELQTYPLKVVLDSPWTLLSYVQSPLTWDEVKFPPSIKGVLSAVISNINTPGIVHQRPFYQCTLEEIKDEVLAQLKLKHLASCLVHYAIDPTVRCLPMREYEENRERYSQWLIAPASDRGFIWLAETGLFLAKPKTFERLPSPDTTISNLFLAGEFIDTPIKIPTMEQANFSGKLCAKKICDSFDVSYNMQRIAYPEFPLKWIRKLDAMIYRRFN